MPADSSSGEPRSFERSRQARRSTIVDFLREGEACKFDFSTFRAFALATVEKHRIARLLPPFINDVQHRHASYLTSEGLPRVLPEMCKSSEVTVQPWCDSRGVW